MKRVPIRHSTSGYYSLISIGWVGGDTQLLLALLSKLPSNYDPEFHIGDSTRGFAAMTLAHIANRPRNALEVYWIRAIWCCDAPKWCEMSWWQMEAQLTRCHPTGAFKPYHMAFNRGRGGKGRERERRDRAHAYPSPPTRGRDRQGEWRKTYCSSAEMRKRRSATCSQCSSALRRPLYAMAAIYGLLWGESVQILHTPSF